MQIRWGTLASLMVTHANVLGQMHKYAEMKRILMEARDLCNKYVRGVQSCAAWLFDLVHR